MKEINEHVTSYAISEDISLSLTLVRTMISNLRIRRLLELNRRFSSLPRILNHEWIIDGHVMTDKVPTQRVEHTVILLHGLLANRKNLRAAAKRISELDSSVGVLNIDLRGHGSSNSTSIDNHNATVTIQDCAYDVMHTLHQLGLTSSRSPVACIGHSFGGRVALSYVHSLLRSHQSFQYGMLRPPKHCWILDSVPGAPDASVAKLIRELHSMQPLQIQTKQQLVTILTEEKGLDIAKASWISTNLRKSSIPSAPWEFSFDLNLANQLLEDISKQKFMDMLSDIVTSTDTEDTYVHFVIAGLNKAWTKEMMFQLKEIQSKSNRLNLVTLHKANHWVHVDDLEGLIHAIKGHLQ